MSEDTDTNKDDRRLRINKNRERSIGVDDGQLSQPRREPYKRQQKADYLSDELDPYEEYE